MNAHTGFETAEDALRFIFAGKATVTLTSKATGEHFTYRVDKGKEENAPYFVKVLNGPDNYANYMYIGFIQDPAAALGEKGRPVHISRTAGLIAGRKGHPDAPSFKAFAWALRYLKERNEVPEQMTIQHEGKCCRCSRKLTHPDSIASGIGPECASKMGA